MDILIIGSGPSVKLLPKLNLDEFAVICINNAWELVPWEKMDMWCRSTDLEIFRKKSDQLANRPHTIQMPGLSSSPKINGGTGKLSGILNHQAGQLYDQMGDKRSTVFCDALEKLTAAKIEVFKSIWFIGCEHDYSGTETHFYGAGRPDPLRYGEEWLLSHFRKFRQIANAHGISLVNATGNYTGLLHKGMFE